MTTSNYGPRANPTRRDISSGSRRHFFNEEKIIHLQKMYCFRRILHISKQAHYVSCPVLELLCSGSLTEKFGDPWVRSLRASRKYSA